VFQEKPPPASTRVTFVGSAAGFAGTVDAVGFDITAVGRASAKMAFSGAALVVANAELTVTVFAGFVLIVTVDFAPVIV
jgi:hypothetical protein